MDKPDLYMTANAMQRRDAAELSEEFCYQIRKMSGRCLDIGSGPGDVAVDIILPKLDPDATIVCSDISDAMLDCGRQKYGNNNRLSFLKLNIETPDLPEDQIEQYDHATSFYCLHWCQNMRQVFENIHNLLRPGGTAFLIFMASDPGFNAYRVLAAKPDYQPYMTDVSRYIPPFQHTERQCETLKSLLEDVGFDVNHCSCENRSWYFKDRETLTKNTIAVNPFIARIPKQLKEVYKKDLIEEIMKQKNAFNKNHRTEIKDRNDNKSENENGNENRNGDEKRICSKYSVFVVHITKPQTRKFKSRTFID